MEDQKVHKEVLSGIHNQMQGIFEVSDQAMYIYLDDANKVCNKKFASMLGYSSPEEWARVDENFPTAFVADGSQKALIGAYQNAMKKGVGSALRVEWKKKSSGTVKSDVILVPVAYKGHVMALHFISKIP